MGKVLVVLFIALGTSMGSTEANAQKADPAGTWVWTLPPRPNTAHSRKITLVLKVKSDKVTGTLSHLDPRGQPVFEEIQDGKLDGNNLSFQVAREQHGDTMTTKYKMKVTADALTGTSDFVRHGDQESVPVLFKRSASNGP